MTTETSPLNRQPDKLDYTSPTQFRFILNQIPKVQFFVQAANIPGISLGEAVIPTPYKDIPYVGDKVTYENLTIQFIVDEHLENYIEMHNWMIGIGFPKSRQQFTNFRSTTSNTSNTGKAQTDIGKVGLTVPERPLYSDATLSILSNKNNPLVEIRFFRLFSSFVVWFRLYTTSFRC